MTAPVSSKQVAQLVCYLADEYASVHPRLEVYPAPVVDTEIRRLQDLLRAAEAQKERCAGMTASEWRTLFIKTQEQWEAEKREVARLRGALPADGTLDGDGVWRGGKWYPNPPSCPSDKLVRPPEPEYIGWQHSRYNGRDFYGSHADELAELAYLRDWKRWAENEIRGYEGWARSVNEALNSGDGSYRP